MAFSSASAHFEGEFVAADTNAVTIGQRRADANPHPHLLDNLRHRQPSGNHRGHSHTAAQPCSTPSSRECQRSTETLSGITRRQNVKRQPGHTRTSGAGGTRTRDLRIMSPYPAPHRPGETVSGFAPHRLLGSISERRRYVSGTVAVRLQIALGRRGDAGVVRFGSAFDTRARG
jgi:hypothetical protein